MDQKILRTAVVGLGKMGLLHASLLNVIPNVQLVAICEKSSFTRKFAKNFLRNIQIAEDISELADSDLDTVYVTTPTSSHFSVAKTIYEDRIAQNLFVEKPLASNPNESRELCDLANNNGGVNMVGYLRRFMVTFMKTKELLSQGIIGKPISFLMNAFSSDFYGVSGNSQVSIARGGVLRDLGSYAIDLALWFFDDMQLKSAEIDSLTGVGAEDAVHFVTKRESDALKGEFSISWCKEGYRMPEVDLLVKGSKGVIEVNDDKVTLSLNNGKSSIWYRHNLDEKVDFWLGSPEYYREDAYFIKSVTTNSIAEPSFITASKVDSFINLIQQEAKKR